MTDTHSLADIIDLSELAEMRLSADRVAIRYRTRANFTANTADIPDLTTLFDKLLGAYQPPSTTQAVDFGMKWQGRRWRGHLYHHIRGWSSAMRLLPDQVLTMEQLDLDPEEVLSLVRGEGLSLFCGPTGSGKSTTMAAVMSGLSTKNMLGDTVTIEQPIEYVHHDKSIEQREVGTDTVSFADGVIEAMRQTPKSIIIGEIRDPETADAAVQAGLTGHRVLATLHAKNIIDVVVRMLALLPDHQRDLLSTALQGIMVQKLYKIPQKEPIPVYETLLIDDAASSIIEKGPDSLTLLNHEFRHQNRQTMAEKHEELVRHDIIPDVAIF